MNSESSVKDHKSDINDTIWITSRVRMISERKALRLQHISWFVVIYYSLFSIILSIFSRYYKRYYPDLDQFIIASSVIVLVAALISYGFRFSDRAHRFGDSYLELQELYDKDQDDKDKRAEYGAILRNYPGHSVHDYFDFLIHSIIFEGNQIKIGDKTLSVTLAMIISFMCRKIVFYSIMIVFFLGPVRFLLKPIYFR